MTYEVSKAIFPVAGLGTRMLPQTQSVPKEMLPILDKNILQYAVEEAAEAGITEMIFVTGRQKRAIEDHLDDSPELEHELARKKNRTAGRNRAGSPKACFLRIRTAGQTTRTGPCGIVRRTAGRQCAFCGHSVG